MIKSKADLKEYLEKDKYVISPPKKHPRLLGDDIWKYEIFLRKFEYYSNCGGGIISKILRLYYKYKHYKYGIKLGISIPINVFGAGLHISHYGSVIVSAKAKVGEFCVIHGCTNIGQSEGADEKAPVLGDNVYIGPGAKLFGDITIGNNVMIGANSVVNKSFGNDCRVAGVPAKIISNKSNSGNSYYYEWYSEGKK